MQSPKDKQSTLVDCALPEGLPAKHCPATDGIWIEGADYRAWQEKQPPIADDLTALADRLRNAEANPAEEDTKGALCPQCGRFLSRGKVETQPPFYVERCPQCEGIWCDRQEWELLGRLELQARIDRLFSPEWQAKLRDRAGGYRERQATIDKLGKDLAERVFQLADALKTHPNGDFGVAYLMRQFERAEDRL